MKKIGLICMVLILLAAAGCQLKSAAAPTAAPQPTAPPPAPTVVPPTALPPAPSPIPPTETPSGPPPEPQVITFKAEDGYELTGKYYPAAGGSAPVVVLMHQVGFNQGQWVSVAPWLQNRGLVVPGPEPLPIFDPSWFPPVPAGLQVAVFTFTFRCWEDGQCSDLGPKLSFTQAGALWDLDAIAAVETAAALSGVDPQRVITAGTSIGADGAVDACRSYNQKYGSGCLAAMPFSPGSYLSRNYTDVVKELTAGGVQVHCLASTGDGPCASTCQSHSDENYQVQIYDGNNHGAFLIIPELAPASLQLLLDLLAMVL